MVDPTVSTRRRKHGKKIAFRDGRPRSQDGAMEDTYELVRPGNFTTKATTLSQRNRGL